MDIETLGTSAVERAIARTGRLVPFINKKDKEPVWDGFVAVYGKSGNTHSNRDLLDEVWVQVKGEVGDAEAETLSYPVRTEDLRQFAKRSYTAFFVVRIGSRERETVYYCPFTKKSIDGILNEKGAQRTASLRFRRFPVTVEEKEALFLALIGGKAEEGESLADNPFLYDAGAVEFWGRSEELEALEDFLSCPEVFRWWGIAAPDGAGKSRLALELKQELEEDGDWTARFLGEEDYEDLDAVLRRYPGPLLLIADDALYQVDALGKWMTALSSRRTRSEPLRLLLLDRDEGWQYDSFAWERQLYKAGHERLLRGSRFDTLLSLGPLDDEALTALIQDFAFAQRRREPSLPALRAGEERRLLETLSALDSERRPLYAMVLTDAFLHDRNAAHWTREPLFDWLVKRERARLREAIRALSTGVGFEDEALFSLCLRLRRIAGVIGRNGALDSASLSVYCAGELEELTAQAEARGMGSVAELLLALGLVRVSERRFCLTGFQPEPLAEYELLHWLRVCDTPSRAQERTSFFWAVLCDGEAVRRFFDRLFDDYAPLLRADPGLWEKLLPADLNLDDRRAAAYSYLLYHGFTRCTDRDKRLYMLRCLERLARELFQTDTDEAASVYNNLGLVYKAMGDYPRALVYYDRFKTICEKVYGTEHPSTATSYNNLGGVYDAMGDYPRALEYHQKALAIREKVYGEEHPSTATSYNNLAEVYRTMEDYSRALEYHQKALAIRKKVYGEEHPDTAASYINLGGVYYAMGDYPCALEYHQKALAINEKVYGEEHPDTATSYNNLGGVYHAIGDYLRALEHFQKALAIVEKVEGPEHPHTAASYNNLGGVYYAMGDYPRALECCQKALAIWEKVYGAEHPDTAQSYNNLGLVYHTMGDYPRALEYHQKALAILKKVYGEEHPDTATSYNNLGGFLYERGEYQQAREYMQKAVTIRERVLGSKHPYTQGSREWLELIEAKLK